MRRSRGFTMVETIVAVAITVILLGVAFVAVANYRRSMLQLELDATAKEVYMAAQNHLFTAMEQGLLETYNTESMGTKDASEKDVYYFVAPTTAPTPSTTLGLMLPFGSIDEMVRVGGSYIIRYQPSTGRILDVFYASPTGLGGLFGSFGDYTFVANEDEYLAVKGLAGSDKARDRRDYNGGVIGYYGGEETAQAAITLKAPSVKVVNGDTLEVIVTNPKQNTEKVDASSLQLRLIIEGKDSKAMMYFTLGNLDLDQSEPSVDSERYKLCLDDVTDPSTRFMEVCKSPQSGTEFIPGEDLKIYAWATADGQFSNVAKSANATANSLFANKSGATDEGDYTAKIASFRHLINLGVDSGFNEGGKLYESVKAVQKTDLLWTVEDGTGEAGAGADADSKGFVENTDYYDGDEAHPLPAVDPHYTLAYDGAGYALTNVRVAESGRDAGLFETLIDGSSVSNLELVNTRVTTTKGSAGALVGKAAGDLTLTNVVAHDADGKVKARIEGDSAAGGLVGSVGKSDATIKIDGCAAAVYVEATGAGSVAGGLIGEVSGSDVSIENSYAGGHTQEGLYKEDAINVKAGTTAGGSTSGTVEIKNCYATTSVSADATAGGFVGSASGATIKDSYATGLVTGGDTATKGAFAGSAGSDFSGCQYFEIIDEGMPAVGGEEDMPTGISAIDKDVNSYNKFFQASDVAADARPYDTPWLPKHYGSKYPYKSVAGEPDYFVAKHYGDWPSPETFVINN